jgi:alanine-synthesizing transaminase
MLTAVPAVSLFEPEGGWSVVLRVPAILSEERLVLQVLAKDDVLIHPGYFFDLEGGTFLVASLLPDPLVFDEAITRLLGGIVRVTHE